MELLKWFFILFVQIIISNAIPSPPLQQHHQIQSSTNALQNNAELINDRFYEAIRKLLDNSYSDNYLNDQSVQMPQQQQQQQQQHQEQQQQHQEQQQPHDHTQIVDTTHLDSPPRPKKVEKWPINELNVGQITAVSINQDGNPVIFHRADRIWAEETFNESEYYQYTNEGPIKVNTILTLSSVNGDIIDSWGAGMFYLPHGMTIDRHGNTWITDVALHQVFKFKPNSVYASIVIGRRFQPGSIPNHLCKPTAVAVATTGEFFIADGYCNNRILKFNAAGRILRVIPQPPEFLSLQVPHGLTLLEHLDLICIADRENMRVVCPKAGLKSSHGEGNPAATIQEPDLGRVFDVAAYGDLVYAINGPTSQTIPVRGFTIDPRSEQIIDHWGDFENPHSIVFCPNGSAMYVTEIGPNKVHKFELF